ncbi:MAG: hypothetical protein QM699_03515 [Amaricoccus sp.]|uniref:hypothetical protein n=1 Tax=Amaricoccus sp. TaxID=1872485 RepID=UPI0039E5068D
MQKLQLIVALAGLAIAVPAVAEDIGSSGDGGAVASPPRAEAPPDAPAETLDTLLAELAEPGRKDWERVESEIGRLWSRSGSPAMDLLLARGNKAMAAEDYPTAIGHFTALVDHAPAFAEGWNARATAYFLNGDFALAMADVEHVLVLNPEHFGALTGLASMLEAMDEPRQALAALRLAEKLNPNRPSIKDGIARLEKQTGEVEL